MADEIEPLSQRYILDTKQYRQELQKLQQMTRRFAENFKRVARQSTQEANAAARGQTKATEQQVQQSATTVQRSLKRMQDTANSVGSRIRLAIVGAMLAAALGVRRFVQVGIAGLARFQSQMIESTALFSGLTAGMFDAMTKKARDLAIEFNFKPEDVARGFFFLASAGLDAAQSLAALPAVTQFAKAGMFDLAVATDLSTDALSALGLKSKDPEQNLKNLTRVMDVLVEANKLANATVEQFSTALTTRAGATLKVHNKTVEEGVAVLAAWADQGVKGEQAGTALGIVTRDLTTRAIENKEAFRQAGVQVFDNTGKLRNYADIIADLENLLKGMSDETAKATLKQLGFADRSLAFIQTLLGMSDAIRGYQAALERAAGATEQLADKQMTAPMERFGQLMQRIRRLMEEQVGAPLLERLMVIVDDMNQNFETFGPRIISTLGSLTRMIGVMLGMKAAILAVNLILITGTKLITIYRLAVIALSVAYNVVAGNMVRASAAMRLFNTTMAKNPVGLLLTVLIAVGAEMLIFRRRTEEATIAISEQRKEVMALQKELERLRGVQLFQRKEELQLGLEEQRKQAEELAKEIRTLQGTTVFIERGEFFGDQKGTSMFLSDFIEKLDELREKGIIVDTEFSKIFGKPQTVTVMVEGESKVMEVSEAVALLNNKVEEHAELNRTMFVTRAALTEAELRGAKDLGFQLEELNKKRRELMAEVIRGEGILSETDMKALTDQLAEYNKKIEETEETIRALEQLGTETDTGKPSPFAGAVDPDDIERAEDALERIILQTKRAGELAAANEEIRESVQRIWEIEDKLRQLRDQDVQTQGIKDHIKLLEGERDELREQVSAFEDFRRTVGLVADGVSNIFFQMAQSTDTKAFSAAIIAELTRLQDELNQKLTELQIRMAMPQLDEESRERLQQEIDQLTEDTRQSVIRIFNALGDKIGMLTPQVSEAFAEIFANLEITDAHKEKLLRDVESVMAGLERELKQREILLALKLISPEEFRDQIRTESEKAKAEVERIWSELPPDLRANVELLEMILGLLDRIKDSAEQAGTRLTKLADSLQNVADMLHAVARFAGVFEGLGQDVAAFVNGLADAISNTSELATNLQLIQDKNLTGLGAVAGVAIPAIGITTGVASMMKGFADRVEEQREAMRRLEDAIDRNTEAIYEQMAEAFTGGIVGGDVSGNALVQAQSIIQQILRLQGRDQEAREQLFRDLSRLGIPGLGDITDLRNQLNDLIEGALGGDISRDQRRRLTDMVLFGQTSTQDLISAFGFDPYTLQLITAFLNKLPVEINDFVGFIQSLNEGLGTFTQDVDGAGEMLRILKMLGVDTQQQMKMFIEFLFNNIGDLPSIFKGRGGILGQISGLDLTSAEDRQKLRDIVTQAFEDLGEGGLDLGDLTPEEFVLILETLLGFADGFGGAVEAMTDAMDAATRRFNVLTDILGVDSLEAAREWMKTFLEGAPEMDSDLKALLEEAAGLDLNTEEGALRFQEIVKFLAQQYLEGNTFGMDPDQFEQLLGSMDNFSDMAMGNVSASRSVQFLRTITEFQGNELVLLANERNWILRDIRSDVQRIANTVGMTLPTIRTGWGAGRDNTVSVPRSLLAVTAESPMNGMVSRRMEGRMKSADQVVLNAYITTQPSMNRMLSDLEREIRRVERSTFGGEKLFG